MSRQGALWSGEELDGQVPMLRGLQVLGHVCPDCACPVAVGDRDAAGRWTCRGCGREQAVATAVPVISRR